MDFFQSLAATRIFVILGILNLILICLVYFTCRCLPSSKFGSKLLTFNIYSRLYKKHCWIWVLFWISVLVHALFAVMYMGWPD